MEYNANSFSGTNYTAWVNGYGDWISKAKCCSSEGTQVQRTTSDFAVIRDQRALGMHTWTETGMKILESLRVVLSDVCPL